MADRGSLLKWSEEKWARWSQMPRLSLTPIPKTKFLLLKSPMSTVYEEKYGDRNVFTVPMYVQRLIAKKSIAVGLAVDCAALDLHCFDPDSKTDTKYYIHNPNEWDDFDIDYCQIANDKPAPNGTSQCIIQSGTIQQFLTTCIDFWKDNPTLHICLFDARGGNGAAAFLAAYYLCHKWKAPVHSALSLIEKASPNSNAIAKGLYDVDLIKQLQSTFKGRKELTFDYSNVPSWWFVQGEDDPLSKSSVTIPAIAGYNSKRTSEAFDAPAAKSARVESSLPIESLSSGSQRYTRAITVLKQLLSITEKDVTRLPMKQEKNMTEGSVDTISSNGIDKYKVTWRSKGRKGFLLFLSDGVFFFENTNDGVQVSTLTCPLYLPNPQKLNMVQHRTLLDVTLVMDQEQAKQPATPRFLINDILVHMGGIVMNKPFHQRQKFIMDGVILIRKKTTTIWGYNKEKIRIRAKEYFDLKKFDFVWKQVRTVQMHETDGTEILCITDKYRDTGECALMICPASQDKDFEAGRTKLMGVLG